MLAGSAFMIVGILFFAEIITLERLNLLIKWISGFTIIGIVIEVVGVELRLGDASKLKRELSGIIEPLLGFAYEEKYPYKGNPLCYCFKNVEFIEDFGEFKNDIIYGEIIVDYEKGVLQFWRGGVLNKTQNIKAIPKK